MGLGTSTQMGEFGTKSRHSEVIWKQIYLICALEPSLLLISNPFSAPFNYAGWGQEKGDEDQRPGAPGSFLIRAASLGYFPCGFSRDGDGVSLLGSEGRASPEQDFRSSLVKT